MYVKTSVDIVNIHEDMNYDDAKVEAIYGESGEILQQVRKRQRLNSVMGGDVNRLWEPINLGGEVKERILIDFSNIIFSNQNLSKTKAYI